jgi:hypothetical protein
VKKYRPDAGADCAMPADRSEAPWSATRLRISPCRQSLEDPDFPRNWPSVFSKGGESLEFQWLVLVEDNDNVDLRLACFLSRELRALVLAAHASEGSDTYGYCISRDGKRERQFFREMEERPLSRIDDELEIMGIPYTLGHYQTCHGLGWIEVALAR